jgi:hypothetical protein
VRGTAYGVYGTTRSGQRDADYRGQAAPRQDPGFRGFGVNDSGQVRRTASQRRIPTPDHAGDRSVSRDSGSAARHEIGRVGSRGVRNPRDASVAPRSEASTQTPRYQRAPTSQRGSDGYALPRRETPTSSNYRASSPRAEQRPAQRYEAPVRSYTREPATPRYSAPQPSVRSEARQYSAPTPTPSYQAPQRSYSAPAPAPQAAPQRSYAAPSGAARVETRSSSGRGSSGSSSGSVRRSGGNRDQED